MPLSVPPSPRTALVRIITGYREACVVHAAAQLGIADALGQRALPCEELAMKLGVQAAPLERLANALVVIGVLRKDDEGRLALTDMGRSLRSDARGSLHGAALLAGEVFLPAWGALAKGVRSGSVPFDSEFGRDVWTHFGEHPQLSDHFADMMVQRTRAHCRGVVRSYDFSSFAHVVDVGGGSGTLLAEVLHEYPALRGTVYDAPHVVATATPLLAEQGFADRCDAVGGDFFTSVPAGADAYLLKSVLHDWDDARCRKVLGACKEAMSPDAKLLVVEYLMPESPQDAPDTVWLDVQMLAITGGQERTVEQHRALYAACGLQLVRVVDTGTPYSLLEVTRAG